MGYGYCNNGHSLLDFRFVLIFMIYFLLLIIIGLLIKIVFFSTEAINKRAVKRFQRLFDKDLNSLNPSERQKLIEERAKYLEDL